jgi:hypothetical protein
MASMYDLKLLSFLYSTSPRLNVFVNVTRFEVLVELRRSSKCVAVLTMSRVKVEVMGAMVVPIRKFNFQCLHFPLLFVKICTRFVCGLGGEKRK